MLLRKYPLKNDTENNSIGSSNKREKSIPSTSACACHRISSRIVSNVSVLERTKRIEFSTDLTGRSTRINFLYKISVQVTKWLTHILFRQSRWTSLVKQHIQMKRYMENSVQKKLPKLVNCTVLDKQFRHTRAQDQWFKTFS